jgi:hypothetical protein
MMAQHKIDKKLKKILDTFMKEKGVSGYSVNGNKIVLYVDDEEHATLFRKFEISGYSIEVIVTGKFKAL